MNLEFLYVIGHYFSNLRRADLLFDIALPLVISLVTLFFFTLPEKAVSLLASDVITLMSILVAFSIASITMLTTGNSESLDDIKRILTKKKALGYQLSLYTSLHVNFTYVVIAEVFSLLIALWFKFFVFASIESWGSRIAFAFMVFCILHVLFLNLRNLTSYYLTLLKNSSNKRLPKKYE